MLDDGAFEPDRRRHRPSGLRLLCLHGYGSNNDITHMQITHLSSFASCMASRAIFSTRRRK